MLSKVPDLRLCHFKTKEDDAKLYNKNLALVNL
jgi:hypothetical protein